MRKSKFTAGQIAAALKQADATSSPPLGSRCRGGRVAVRAAVAILLTGVLAASAHSDTVPPATPAPASDTVDFTTDGRLPLSSIMERFDTLSSRHGWQAETLYAYPGVGAPEIKAWHTPHRGEALWILSGIHGEEPAGPNAIAGNIEIIAELAASGVPMVVIPLANPKAYRHNWRYPNTAERDWKKGGYSVGDAEYLLPDLEQGSGPRAAAAPGPETAALTQFVLRMARHYPPRLVLDLHEDELSTAGGYIYSQGTQPEDNPVGAEVVRLLQATGIPLRESGKTRFGEPVVKGVISHDDAGAPIRDGSIDELLAATEVFVDGSKRAGPAARTVIVVETPAFEGSQFDLRVAAQGAVVQRLRELWQLSSDVRRTP
jgi:hypothetical protein